MVKISLNRANYLFCASHSGQLVVPVGEDVVEELGIPTDQTNPRQMRRQSAHLLPPLRGFGPSGVAAAIVGTQKK